MSSYIHVIRHGFDFHGLCDRVQFWSFMAVHCLISLLLLILELRAPHQGWLDIVYSLFIFIFLLWLLTLPSQDGIAVEAEHHA